MTTKIAMQRIGYRDAVARQPESLEEVLRSVTKALDALDLAGFRGKAIGFAGIGASYQAALAAAVFLRAAGFGPLPIARRISTTPSISAAEAFVALSASGQSREIAEVMQLRPKLPRIAICRGSDNPLAKVTDAVIATSSGADNGASSTGYTGMLLAIGLLADRILGGAPSADWARLPGAVAETLGATAGLAKQAAALLAGRSSIDLVGAGAGFATAGEAAMLIREAVRVPAAGWDTLNYLHGPMESQDAKTGLIAFGTGREVQIAQGCRGLRLPLGADHQPHRRCPRRQLTVIAVPGFGNAIADAILEIAAAQLIVAEMQDAAGLTNITFRYRQTDTKLKPWSPTEV